MKIRATLNTRTPSPIPSYRDLVDGTIFQGRWGGEILWMQSVTSERCSFLEWNSFSAWTDNVSAITVIRLLDVDESLTLTATE